MIKPLFLGVAVFFFSIHGAQMGHKWGTNGAQITYKFYPGHQQLI